MDESFDARAERISRWVQDPSHRAQRNRALRMLETALTQRLRPLGYRQRGSTWRLEGNGFATLVQLQRGSGGYACHLNLGFERTARWPLRWPLRGRWSASPYVRLAEFADPAERDPIDQILYVDLVESGIPAAFLEILDARALRWLADSHAAAAPRDPAAYRSP